MRSTLYRVGYSLLKSGISFFYRTRYWQHPSIVICILRHFHSVVSNDNRVQPCLHFVKLYETVNSSSCHDRSRNDELFFRFSGRPVQQRLSLVKRRLRRVWALQCSMRLRLSRLKCASGARDVWRSIEWHRRATRKLLTLPWHFGHRVKQKVLLITK